MGPSESLVGMDGEIYGWDGGLAWVGTSNIAIIIRLHHEFFLRSSTLLYIPGLAHRPEL